MKYAIAAAIVALLIFGAWTAGDKAIRSWRTSVAVRTVRLRGAEE